MWAHNSIDLRGNVMSSLRIVPLILAGGVGARLWPLSRDAMPKRFLPLVGDKSTCQQALMRLSRSDLFAPPIVMTRDAFHFFCSPASRGRRHRRSCSSRRAANSGPAIAVGAALAGQRDPAAVVLAIAASFSVLTCCSPELARFGPVMAKAVEEGGAAADIDSDLSALFAWTRRPSSARRRNRSTTP